MLRLKVSQSKVTEDFVALPFNKKVMPAKHILAISFISLTSLTFALQSPTFNSSIFEDEDLRYMSEAERSYLMAQEQEVELPQIDDLSNENYEDYDIPESQFTQNVQQTTLPHDEGLFDAKKTLPQYIQEKPQDRMSGLIAITPLKTPSQGLDHKVQVQAPALESSKVLEKGKQDAKTLAQNNLVTEDLKENLTIKTLPHEASSLQEIKSLERGSKTNPSSSVDKALESENLHNTQGLIAKVNPVASSLAKPTELNINISNQIPLKAVTPQEPQKVNEGIWYAYTVSSGDNLSRIFSFLDLPKATLKRVIASSKNNEKALALNVGDHIHFLVDKDNILLEMVKPSFGEKQVHYTRYSASDDFVLSFEDKNTHVSDPKVIASFKEASQMPSALAATQKRKALEQERLMAQKEREQGAENNKTRPRLIIASINKKESFDRAGKRAGLTSSEIRTIKTQLAGRYDLKKLKAGDSFRVLFNGIGTRALINAVEFQGSQGTFAIYRNPDDKGFYAEGEYVPTAGIFRRFPLADSIKINSKFNPHRRHPVTGKITPHKGIDFKAAVGTPVYAPADGTVTFAGYQRAAGYYIIIRHQGAYSTVYMHLSKMDVKKGDKVIVGQVIARTGNTGRTTGPHLHYEVRINDRAVDPLRIKLPSNSHPHLAREQREAFESNVKLYKVELYTESLAKR